MNTTSKTILSSTLLIAFLAGTSAYADGRDEHKDYSSASTSSESVTTKKAYHRPLTIAEAYSERSDLSHYADNKITAQKTSFTYSTVAVKNSLKDDKFAEYGGQ